MLEVHTHCPMSAAWCNDLERRFYDHNRKVNGSTPTLASLLRSWINKMLRDNYLCIVESNKQQI